MKRENLRRIILSTTAIFMPILMFFMSPIIIVMAAGEGTIAACTLTFLILFILSLVIGRFWCGWICPCGGMQDIIGMGFDKKTKKSPLDYLKYIFFIFWFGAIVLFFATAGGIRSINVLYNLDNGIGGLYPAMLYLSWAMFAALFVLTAIFGSRTFCRYLCPMCVFFIIGRKIGKVCKIPQLGLIPNAGNCIGCNRCTRSCPMGIEVSKMVRSGDTYDSNCINCGACSYNCKKGALRYGFKGKI